MTQPTEIPACTSAGTELVAPTPRLYGASDYGLTQVAYSVGAFGKRLGVSRSTVFSMIRDGRIATTRINNRTFIPTPAFVDLLNANLKAAA